MLGYFDEILGQANAVQWLRGAIRADRLPHGIIFSGPAGVGKGTVAGVLSAQFLCETPRDTEPCGTCGSCTLLSAGAHPDFHHVYRQLIRLEKKDVVAKDLSVLTVRQYLIAPAGLKSAMNVGKVFVVEDADLMNAQAQNALLKTLEEPAGRTLIVLLTDQPASLLPTIRSRCQMLRFGSLDAALMREELSKRGISAERAGAAAKFAEGSLGSSLRWLEDGVIDRAGQLESQLESLVAGTAPKGLQDWLKGSADAYAEKQQERDALASKDQMTREGLVLYLTLAGNFFRRLLKSTDDADSLERACSAIDVLARGQEYLESNVNVALALQQVVMGLGREFQPAPAGGR